MCVCVDLYLSQWCVKHSRVWLGAEEFGELVGMQTIKDEESYKGK